VGCGDRVGVGVGAGNRLLVPLGLAVAGSPPVVGVGSTGVDSSTLWLCEGWATTAPVELPRVTSFGVARTAAVMPIQLIDMPRTAPT
jgi:hypothetical protein